VTRLARQLARVALATSAIAFGGIALAGCGTSTIEPHGAARAVSDVVSRQTGFHPTDVKCPSGVAARAGGSFECHFTGPGGQPYTASVRIESVHGKRVLFYISTKPTT
jgi:hypothetical protein